MTVKHVGSMTLGSALPTALAAQGAIDASIGLVLPEIQAKLAGLLAVNLIPPTIAASLTTALQLVANIQAAITVGAPAVDIQLAAVAQLIAELQAQIVSLQAQLAFSATLSATLGASGIHLYSYDGEAGELGSELQAELSGGFPGGQPSDATFAMLAAGTTPAAIAAIKAMFKT